MSSDFGRHELGEGLSGDVSRRPPVHAHIGDYRSFLRRYEVQAAEAVERGPQAIRALGPNLLRWVADPRNLRSAWDFLSQRGGHAPGPNGFRYSDFESHEVWDLMRILSGAIKDREYGVGRPRTRRISKGPGRGYRELSIADIEDRVVGRAVVQIVQPLHDPGFDAHSYGFRPGRDRQHAIAHALVIAKQQGRMVGLVEDLRNAFDRVPRQRLLDLLRRTLPEDVVQLIAQFANNVPKHGVPQGNPLSPLLLNIYLDHFLDKPWRKLHPDIPLLRTADDLLGLCSTVEEARMARSDLERILIPTGMILKGDPVESIRNLTSGDNAEWLGYRIDGRLSVHIAERAWNKLRERLDLVHTKQLSPLGAISTIRSWLDQQGPCFPSTDRDQAYARISEIARELAFDEIPSRKELSRRWQRAYARWCRLKRAATTAAVGGTTLQGSSACHVRLSAPCGRRGGASSDAPSLPVFEPDEDVTVHTDGCCLPSGVGGWACRLDAPGRPLTWQRSYWLKPTTNNRAELTAAIKALESFASPTHVPYFPHIWRSFSPNSRAGATQRP